MLLAVIKSLSDTIATGGQQRKAHTADKAIETATRTPHPPPLTSRIRSVTSPLFISPSCIHSEGKSVATFYR